MHVNCLIDFFFFPIFAYTAVLLTFSTSIWIDVTCANIHVQGNLLITMNITNPYTFFVQLLVTCMLVCIV